MTPEDLDYQLFYYIPYPYSQKYEDLDENHEYCSYPAEEDTSGIYADAQWVDSLRNNQL